MSRRRAYVGLYGNVPIPKERCDSCGGQYAFVIDGLLQCCNTPFTATPRIVKREACPEQERKRPSAAARRACLREQEDRCLYCERQFGSYVTRGIRAYKLRVAWDHAVPFAYSQDNRDVNFVAACHICNGLKSSRIYPTLEVARVDLQFRWSQAGYVHLGESTYGGRRNGAGEDDPA